MRRALLPAVVLGGCICATASAWTPQKQLGSPIFTFAGGKITCIIQKAEKNPTAVTYIRCDGKLVGGDRAAIAKTEAQCEASAKKYGYDSGVGGLALKPTGPGEVNCISDALGGPYKTMPAGATLTNGPFTCSMAAAGLTCSTKGGHGFVFGASSWRVY